MKMSFKLSLAGTVGAIAMSLSGAAMAQEITGAGATFPAPVYSKWAADYNKATGVKVNYQSVGSGAGIKQIDAKTVAFGASDMPLKDEELKARVENPIQHAEDLKAAAALPAEEAKPAATVHAEDVKLAAAPAEFDKKPA